MCRLFVIVFALALVYGQAPPTAKMRETVLEIPRPKVLELDSADKIRLLEAQRLDLSKNEAYQRARAEMLEAQKAATASSAQVDQLVQELRSKYGCMMCELGWDHKWSPVKGAVFQTEPKKDGDIKDRP